MSYRYIVHGLIIVSDTAMPGLEVAGSRRAADWRISFRAQLPACPETAEVTRRHQLTVFSDGHRHWFDFAADGECVITQHPGQAATGWFNMAASTASAYVSGLLAAWLLRRLGRAVLHGAVAARNGKALVLLGESGRGKSTTLGMLCGRGWRFVADDLAVIEPLHGAHRLRAGPPRMRLWPDSTQALGIESESLPRVFADSEKRYVEMHARCMDTGSLTLAWVAILDASRPRGGEVLIRQAAATALVELISQIAVADLPGCAPTPHDFETLADIVAAIPVFRVANGGAIEDLPPVLAALDRLAIPEPATPEANTA